MVGKDGAHAAWLLAQHADRDPAFQRRRLDLVTQAAARGQASPTELAYLTDRGLLAEGKSQEYGPSPAPSPPAQVRGRMSSLYRFRAAAVDLPCLAGLSR